CIRYNQIRAAQKQEAYAAEQAAKEAEQERLEKETLIEEYKAEARTYYDAHTKDFIFEPDMTRERFTDEYVTLRQAGSTGDEAIESIRKGIWAVTYFENPENVYVNVEEAKYFENPHAEEELGVRFYGDEVSVYGIAEKYNEQTELKDVMYIFTEEIEQMGYIPSADGETITEIPTETKEVVSSISNFVDQETDAMIQRKKAAEEEAERLRKEAEAQAKAQEEAKQQASQGENKGYKDRTVPYKEGTLVDADGKSYPDLGAYNGDGYYGNGYWVTKLEGKTFVCNKEDYDWMRENIDKIPTEEDYRNWVLEHADPPMPELDVNPNPDW
ncbi:MAG: cell envelope integrity protein TolA, partial [Lachnospiraceae bacterium]|nr:cell envelope integrity protein TolA [Lachnospiraceae bacterium]